GRPRVEGDRAAGLQYTQHFGESQGRARRKDMSELAGDHVECGIGEGQLFNVAFMEFDFCSGDLCVEAGAFEKLGSEIEGSDFGAGSGCGNGGDACATGHVKDTLAARNTG